MLCRSPLSPSFMLCRSSSSSHSPSSLWCRSPLQQALHLPCAIEGKKEKMFEKILKEDLVCYKELLDVAIQYSMDFTLTFLVEEK